MRKWDPALALDIIERERVTGVSGVPTMVWDLVNDPSIEGRDLTSLRSIGGGGAASPPELLRRIQRVLPGRGAGTGYGMTESSALATSIGGADYAERPTSVGVPVPIVDVGIFDDDGNELPVGEVGEIWIARLDDRARLLAPARGDGGDVHRRVAALRRPRPHRRGGLRLHRRPGQGHGDPRWREHRQPRGRGGAVRPPGCARGSGVPGAPPDARRGGRRRGAPASGRGRDRSTNCVRTRPGSSPRSRCRRTSGCAPSRSRAATPARC